MLRKQRKYVNEPMLFVIADKVSNALCSHLHSACPLCCVALFCGLVQTKTRAWGFKKNLSEADKAALVKARDTVETFTLTDKITQSISHTPWSKTREQKKREAEAAAAKAREEANSRKRSRPSSSSLASSNAAALPTGGVAKAARMAALQAAEEAKIAALKAQFHLSGAKMQIAPRK